jgi:two-component system, LuxR family, response regulator FixJ
VIANRKPVLASAAAYAATTLQGINSSISAVGFISDGLLRRRFDQKVRRHQLVQQAPFRNWLDCELVESRGYGPPISLEEGFQRSNPVKHRRLSGPGRRPIDQNQIRRRPELLWFSPCEFCNLLLGRISRAPMFGAVPASIRSNRGGIVFLASKSVIHVVEDDQAMRDSLVELLEDAGHAVRAYTRAEELLSRAADIEPGCIISDVRMPGLDGLTLLRRLRDCGSKTPLMLITGHGDVAMAVAAMKAGAVDFLEKPFEADVLLAAVGAALRHPVSDTKTEDAEASRQLLQKLTSREYEVFEQLAAGNSNKEIAAQLGISPRTVEFHRANIMQKMAVRSLPELVRVWLSAGLAPSPK